VGAKTTKNSLFANLVPVNKTAKQKRAYLLTGLVFWLGNDGADWLFSLNKGNLYKI